MNSAIYCDLWCHKCVQQKECKKAKNFDDEFKNALKKQEMPRKEKS